MYILTITETIRNSLKDEAHIFNKIEEHFDTVQEVKEYLINRYGKLPSGKNKVYVDINKKSHISGFLHSFWNKDRSHNSNSWFQTDWVTFEEYVPNILPDKNFFKELFS